MEDKKFYLDETKAWKVSMRILKYLTLIAIVLGVYTYYPHSDVRNLEAEKYFMTELNKAMKDKDVLETDLTGFTKFPWTDVCIGYSKNKTFKMIFIKERFLRDIENNLDLSEYISMHRSQLSTMSDKYPDMLASICTYKGYNFIITKVDNTKNKYIFDTQRNYKKRKKVQNEK